MSTNLKSCVFFISFLLVNNVVMAHDSNRIEKKEKRIAEFMAKHDKNKDGLVSREEAEDEKIELFSELDTNENNALTLSEFSKLPELMKQKRLAKRFKRLDKNNDGVISNDEFIANMPLFERVDTNSDDFISSDEMKKHKSSKKYYK